MSRYYFDNGNGTSLDRDLRFLSYPEIDRGCEEVTLKTIPGRKGTVTVHTGTYSDTTILCHLHIENEFEMIELAYLETKIWLESTKKISFSDNPGVFYKVKKVTVEKMSKSYGRFGTFDVTFVCDPGEYIAEGSNEYQLQEIAFNPYSECCPVYKVSGNGTCILEVNGCKMRANVTKELTIDTELTLAYSGENINNTAVSGDYEKIHLKSGKNSISITDSFEIKVVPNWRIL